MPTDHFRLGIATILAFTLGAGLTSPELFELVGTDVVTADGGVNVRVNGDRAREIPVLDAWASEVGELAKGVGPGPVFTPHRTGKKTGRSRIANFIATCPPGDAPGLTQSRLRNTWIVGHINAGTHFMTLSEAAGVAPEAIARLARFAEGPEKDVADRVLRGLKTS